MFYCTKLTLFFRSDKYSSANHAFSILEGIFFADAVVPEIGIPDPEGILSPVFTECFQVPVVEMLTVWEGTRSKPSKLSTTSTRTGSPFTSKTTTSTPSTPMELYGARKTDDIEPLSKDEFLFTWGLKSESYKEKENGQTADFDNLSALAPPVGLEPTTL